MPGDKCKVFLWLELYTDLILVRLMAFGLQESSSFYHSNRRRLCLRGKEQPYLHYVATSTNVNKYMLIDHICRNYDCSTAQKL